MGIQTKRDAECYCRPVAGEAFAHPISGEAHDNGHRNGEKKLLHDYKLPDVARSPSADGRIDKSTNSIPVAVD